jgi:hypothetical protein
MRGVKSARVARKRLAGGVSAFCIWRGGATGVPVGAPAGLHEKQQQPRVERQMSDASWGMGS